MPFPSEFILCNVKQIPSGQTPRHRLQMSVEVSLAGGGTQGRGRRGRCRGAEKASYLPPTQPPHGGPPLSTPKVTRPPWTLPRESLFSGDTAGVLAPGAPVTEAAEEDAQAGWGPPLEVESQEDWAEGYWTGQRR